MRSTQYLLAAVVISAVMLCAFIPGRAAAGNLKLGKTNIKPYFSITETYTDNVFATDNNTEDDFITTYIPGVTFEHPFRRHLFLLDLNITDTDYSEYADEDTTDHYGMAHLGFKLGSRMELALSDTYTQGHEDRGTSATGGIEVFRTNEIAGLLSHALMDVSLFQVEYKFTNWDFKRAANNFRERDESDVFVYLFYRVMPKTSVFVEYDHETVDYRTTDPATLVSYDNISSTGMLGLKWDVSDRSTGTIKGGYTWREYDNDNLDDYETWRAALDINHRFNNHSSIYLNASRQIIETSLSGTRYMTSSGGFAEFKHDFYTKFAFLLRGSYNFDEFSDILPGFTEEREDTRISTGGGITYTMNKWATLALNFDHSQRNSNEDLNDYEDNRTQLALHLTF